MSEPRVALVTGGARGIGAEVARGLHAQGRRVAIADLLATDAEALAAELDGRGYACDVTDSERVREVVAAIETDLGPVDILVNCAGFDRFVRFVDTDEDFWDTIIDINYKGTLRTCHAVLPGMMERGWGRIVNVASEAGPRRQFARVRLLRREGRRDRIHQDDRTRVGQEGRHVQRRLPRPHRRRRSSSDMGDAGELPSKIVARARSRDAHRPYGPAR